MNVYTVPLSLTVQRVALITTTVEQHVFLILMFADEVHTGAPSCHRKNLYYYLIANRAWLRAVMNNAAETALVPKYVESCLLLKMQLLHRHYDLTVISLSAVISLLFLCQHLNTAILNKSSIIILNVTRDVLYLISFHYFRYNSIYKTLLLESVAL